MSSSSSSRNWFYDVFVSFRGEDIRKNFLSHFLKELDRKMISAFKDMEIEKSQSLEPVLKKAIEDSRIAIVIFSEKYASSAWCLNEMLEIVKCKKEFGQIVIPVFYGLEPFHVRWQTGDFGMIFKETCEKNKKTKDGIELWRKALTDVANLVGYDSKNWKNNAKLIDDIVSDVLDKLNVTPSKDFEHFVGIEDHIAEMISMLDLNAKEVRMVGIWGPSGIGKTTVARALESGLSRHFQGKVFIDRRFISKSTQDYSKSNTVDYNMKLHLQEAFLSKILNKEGIKVDHLRSVGNMLKHQKVLIFIDDLDNQVVLEALVGGDEWFGPGSRIIVITKDKRLLEGHGIDHIYKVALPSEKQSLEIFCQSAFRQNSPPDGLVALASEAAALAGGLPLGLEILGKVMKNRKEKAWMDLLSRHRKSLNGDIEKTLRVSYDELDSKEDKAIFRHIACFFNGVEVNSIKLMLAHSSLDVDIGLQILIDKSLIRVIPSCNNTNIVEMHCLVGQMGKQIVCEQSVKPGEREFLIDSTDVCNVLRHYTGTENVLGISLDLDEIDKLQIHENAFERMSNLRFLKFYKKSLEQKKEVRYIKLPERFNDFPDKLKLLTWPGYPMICMPSDFCPEYLVELRIPNSKLKKLWEGVESLTYLKDMDFSESKDLEEIPDLSEATNLETINLRGCSSLVELPSSIQNLNKLTDLNLAGCTKLEALPNGTNLQSLIRLVLTGCSQLKVFPDISSNIQSIIADKTAFQIFPSTLHLENLVELRMEQTLSARLWEGAQPLSSLMTIVLSGSKNLKEIPDLSMATSLKTINLNGCSSLVEIPSSSIQNLNKLTNLDMVGCSSLETLPVGINLKSLYRLNLKGCSKLKSFPDISNNISILNLNQTAIEEVPRRIENFSSLESLEMWECKNLKSISSRIFKLNSLDEVSFSECEQLTDVEWPEETGDRNNTPTNLSMINFTNCSPSNQENFIRRSTSKYLTLPGKEVPPYFTHISTGSFLTINLHRHSLSQQPFLDFKACIVVSEETIDHPHCFTDITVLCQFRDMHGNYFEPPPTINFSLHQYHNHMIIFDCRFPLNHECYQVEIEFQLISIRLKLKECGIRLLDAFLPSPATQNEAKESEVYDDKSKETVLEGEDCGKNSDDEGIETAPDNDEANETALDEEDCGENSDDEGNNIALDDEDCGENSDDEGYETALDDEEFGYDSDDGEI